MRDGSTPIAITTNAGIIVTSRRTVTGIWRRMNPCITTWPDSVPTAELERPGGDQREREERARRAAEDRLERLVRRCRASATWSRPVR